MGSQGERAHWTLPKNPILTLAFGLDHWPFGPQVVALRALPCHCFVQLNMPQQNVRFFFVALIVLSNGIPECIWDLSVIRRCCITGVTNRWVNVRYTPYIYLPIRWHYWVQDWLPVLTVSGYNRHGTSTVMMSPWKGSTSSSRRARMRNVNMRKRWWSIRTCVVVALFSSLSMYVKHSFSNQVISSSLY